jgi:hypothetical protein
MMYHTVPGALLREGRISRDDLACLSGGKIARIVRIAALK